MSGTCGFDESASMDEGLLRSGCPDRSSKAIEISMFRQTD